MALSELFGVLKAVLFHPLTLIILCFFLLYLMLVSYVANYRRKVKPKKAKKTETRPIRRRRREVKTEEEEEPYDPSEYTDS